MVFIVIASVIVAALFGAYAWRLHRSERMRSEARVSALAAAIEGSSANAPAMFDLAPGSAVQSRPLLKVAVGFGMAVAIIVVIAMTGDRHEAPVAAVLQSAGPASSQESLELLSMRHERVGNGLKVTGLVRNPGGAAPGPITAVVFAFDRDGSFVASGRAPLEFGTVAAGDESPFQVTIPDVKDVGRYRVSFRTAAGVVRHVDRRPTLQVSAH
jgi:hypothetical protein